MISRLTGTLIWKQQPYLMIDNRGIGYELESSLNTFSLLPEIGGEVALFIHFLLKDNSYVLYGFHNTSERSLFRELINVTGIGPRSALLILSQMTVNIFVRCIQNSDIKQLVRLPGIGKKTAERLIIELRDKLIKSAYNDQLSPYTSKNAISSNLQNDAISALVALGYKTHEASKMVAEVYKEGEISSEALIRRALNASVRR